jgi:arylformamidase
MSASTSGPPAGGASWIDVTVPIHAGMVHWPGDPAVRIARVRDLERGDEATVSELSLGAHTGTHVDAPAHFLAGGRPVDAIEPDALVGPARVVELAAPGAIAAEDLAPLEPRPGERLLLRTRNSERCWSGDRFVEDFVHLSPAAARLLVERGIRTVGVDYLSVGGGGEDGREVHRILLGAGVCVIEGLDLRDAPAGAYDLLCLPLRIRGGDGAPARALLRPLR